MKAGKFFNCSQLSIEFCVHSLLSTWKEVNSDLRLFIDSTTILDLFHAKTVEKTANISAKIESIEKYALSFNPVVVRFFLLFYTRTL